MIRSEKKTSSEGKSPARTIPRHIAIIMDGNGRWAKQRGVMRMLGHRKGAKTVKDIVIACRNLGVGYLTLYAFSDENWQRPHVEVSFLMRLLKAYLKRELKTFMDYGVRLNVIGDVSRFPEIVKKEICSVMAATKNNRSMTLNLALGYGGRQEIARAVYRFFRNRGAQLADLPDDEQEATQLIYQGIQKHLDTADQPDPDLVIRTSGEFRISNFLLWQISYSEVYISGVMWPEFTVSELMKAIEDYGQRERRFGGVKPD